MQTQNYKVSFTLGNLYYPELFSLCTEMRSWLCEVAFDLYIPEEMRPEGESYCEGLGNSFAGLTPPSSFERIPPAYLT